MPCLNNYVMFSYIIMNPPYNDVNGTMLHYKFLCKALEVAETVVSIQPATWMNQQKNRAGLPLNGRGATINIIQDSEHIFSDAALGYSLTVSCFTKKYNDILVNWGNGNSSRYPDIESVNLIDQYKLLNTIINKGNNIEHNSVLRDHTYGRRDTNGGLISGNRLYAADMPKIAGKWIVQLAQLIPDTIDRLNRWGLLVYDKFNPVYQHDGSDKFPNCCCIFDTEQEAHNCYAYLVSDLVRAYCIAYKRGSSPIEIIKHIPWPATFDTDPALWTNEAVSDRAGLDQKEREWLREMLPDCYNIRI